MEQDPSEVALQLFDELVELPHDQRTRLLHARCEDHDTRREVQSLLAAYDDAGGFLGERQIATPQVEPHGIGSRIGHYELLELLGEGGFARVFLARQSFPVRRDVAMKLLKVGMDTRAVIARFELERQALAMMDHPTIAAVYDAGATETGRPFFVMELVRGPRITQYCRDQRLDVLQRVRLFIDVCLGVQHAHTKGILHRDLKPSNLLVATVDGQPLPKIIDFGVAKATQQQLTDATIVTQAQQLLGTLQYMSPEQALSGGSDVDTRSDIYSLGAVLYELVAGMPPLDAPSRTTGALEQLRRLTSDEELPPPSTRADEHERRQVRGELDWIIGKCLEKDRSRRYESAAALASDLRAFLDQRPIAAAPPDALYRVRKFARRHAAAVTATLLVAATLVVGSIVSTMQAVRATRAERLAQHRLAEVEAANASLGAVNTFLTRDVIGSAEPEVTRGRHDLTVREALDNAAQPLGTRFAESPLIEASLRDSIAMAYLHLGHADLAQPHGERAVAQRRQILGDEHQDTISAINNYAAVLKALARYADAEAMCRPALETSRRVLGEDHRYTLSLLDIYATSLTALGRWDESEPLSKQAWEQARRVLGDDDRRTMTALNNYARVLQLQGRFADAEPLFRDVLERRRRIDGEDSPRTLTVMNNLALVLKELGRYADAAELYQEALQHRRRVLGDDHRETILTLANYSILLHRLGRLAEAEPLSQEAMERRRRVMGAEHPHTLMSMSNHAELLRASGRAEEAEPLAREALEGRRRVLGEEHPETLSSLNNYAVVLQALGRDAEAEPLLRRTMELRRQRFGDDHPTSRSSMSNYANTLRVLGRAEEGEPFARLAVESARRVLGEDHPDTIKLANNHAALLYAMGQRHQAVALYREVMLKYREMFGDEHPDTLTSTNNYASALASEGNDAEAEPLLAAVYERAPRIERSPRMVALMMTGYGCCLARLAQYEKAEAPLREAYRRLHEANLGAHPKMREVIEALAAVCENTHRAEEAARLWAELASLNSPSTQPAINASATVDQPARGGGEGR